MTATANAATKPTHDPLRGYKPLALSFLSIQTIRALRVNPEQRKAWETREWRRCSRSFVYFFSFYSSHTPASGGVREPITPRPYQIEQAEQLEAGKNLINLKARRMGWTTILAHYLVWVAAFKESTPGAVCISISKTQRDANHILQLCKDILDYMPDYLYVPTGAVATTSKGRRSRDNTTQIGFPTRGSQIISMPASSGAIRGYAATVLAIDEMAHIQNARALWTSALPVIEGGGQALVGSTGNGRSNPEQGGAFAWLWDQARGGAIDFYPSFVNWRQRPDFTTEWYEERLAALGPNMMQQEYPETEEEALQGDTEGLYFKISDINAAQKRGEDLYKSFLRGELQADRGTILDGVDFGVYTAGVICIPLPGHNILVMEEKESTREDAESFAHSLNRETAKYSELGELKTIYYDSAGAQQAQSMKRILTGTKIRIEPVRFNKVKLDTLDHIRTMTRRAEQGEERGCLFISPLCKNLPRQLKAAEKREADIKKDDDHLIDALITVLAEHRLQWTKAYKPR